MALHGVFADAERLADVLVLHASGHIESDLPLALGEAHQCIGRGLCFRGHGGQDLLGKLVGKRKLAVGHRANRGKELFWTVALKDQPPAAELYDLSVIQLAVGTGEDNRCNPASGAIQGAQDVEAIAPGHEQVEDQHIGMVLLHLGESFLAVGGQPLDMEIGLRGKQCCERFPQDGVVVGYDNANLVFRWAISIRTHDKWLDAIRSGHGRMRGRLARKDSFSMVYSPLGRAGSLSVTIDEELSQLDDYVRRLKIEYDIYFGGGSKKSPAELEWRVNTILKKYSDGSKLNYAQRFRFNSIQQRYALFSALWQQKLRIKEEGYRRPQDAVLGIQGLRGEEQHAAEEALKAHAPHQYDDRPFSIACSDADSEREHVDALFRALSDARSKTGESGGGTIESFRNFVRQKTAQIRKQYGCTAVEYSVESADGQVRLKAKPKT